MKLVDDSEIPAARRNPREPHHSYKLLKVAVRLKLGRLIREDAAATTWEPHTKC
jgi:hypothetical protein